MGWWINNIVNLHVSGLDLEVVADLVDEGFFMGIGTSPSSANRQAQAVLAAQVILEVGNHVVKRRDI